MTIKIAINGYGRIGRNVLRAHHESRKHDLAIVAINDLSSPATCAHLTCYDTVQGRFPKRVELNGDVIVIEGDYIKVLSERDPARLPWGTLGVDVVLECTGRFTSKRSAAGHLQSGAKKIVISALGGTDVDATVVYGINHHELKPWHTVISNASCTTNCLAPVALPLHREIGIVSGMVTSIHGYTSDQALTDVCHEDLRRGRSATMNIIPTTTGAADALGRILPELSGRLDGCGIRIPTINVAMLDLAFVAARDTTVEEVNAVMHEASAAGTLAGVLRYSQAPLVSIDFNHDPASATFDATLTKVAGRQVKVSAWYDNEWGYANRMLDTTMALMSAQRGAAPRYATKATMIDPQTVSRMLEIA
jgi:glyceraldehyde 3-phosphate dehydrogenase (phosphorylating)